MSERFERWAPELPRPAWWAAQRCETAQRWGELPGEHERLAEAVSRLACEDIVLEQPPGWETAVYEVMDCVLSLRRSRPAPVQARLARFSRAHPQLCGLEDLLVLIDGYTSPQAFGLCELGEAHSRRLVALRQVCRALLRELEQDWPGGDERERLAAWADARQPQDFICLGAPGFGPAGFQDLRRRFGAPAALVDGRLAVWVGRVLHRRLAMVDALDRFERACQDCGTPAPLAQATLQAGLSRRTRAGEARPEEPARLSGRARAAGSRRSTGSPRSTGGQGSVSSAALHRQP
ncbi:MAG: hypothetical protein ACKOC5_11130 [Chloroflexota bacterium]